MHIDIVYRNTSMSQALGALPANALSKTEEALHR